MGWFGRNKAKVVAADDFKSAPLGNDTKVLDDETPELVEHYDDDALNDKAQDVMANNLDVMRDIVFRIREDEEFAKSIYSNCPRLQHLLKEHPDLRPIFEDPKLVRINFEKVYRDQGGVLPEDEEDKEEPGVFRRAYDFVIAKIAIITAHPLFKVFKMLMIIKKIVGLLSPTKGFGLIKGFFVGLFTDPDVALDGDIDDNGNPANLELRMQLTAAAEHMEDPEVQERMDEMLENPDMMEETIENDPQLRALRDENQLCAALMDNPDTMRILVDPDNLRALAEAPDLIEQDFLDPSGFVPEEVPELDAPADEPMLDGRSALLPEDVPETEAPEVEAEGPEEEDDGNILEQIDENREDGQSEHRSAARAAPRQQQRQGQKEGDKDEARGWIHAAAGVIGGQAMSALGVNIFGGGEDDLGVGDSAPEISAEAPAVEATALPEGAALPQEIEPTFGVVELNTNAARSNSTARGSTTTSGGKGGIFGAAGGLVVGTALGSMLSADSVGMVKDFQEKLDERRAEAENEDTDMSRGEGSEKGGRFAFLGAMRDFAKDNLISSALGGIVGDDLAEGILDTKDDVEEVREGDNEDDKNDDDNSRNGNSADQPGRR
jgi:hypothetical protein